MKTIFLTTVAALAAAAAPAAAQYYPSAQYPSAHHQYQYPATQYPQAQYPQGQTTAEARIDARIDMLQTRLNAGIRNGAINWREAQPLHQRMHQLSRLERQYAVGGMDARERADLRERLRALRQEIRTADNGSYDRYEQVDRYGYYLENGGAYGAYGNGYGGSAYGQGGPYEPVPTAPQAAPGGVLGTIVNGLFGTGGLQIGQRATGNLYAVPPEYQGQFRDGYDYYYRSDGRNIYQIDTRNHVVARVYNTNR